MIKWQRFRCAALQSLAPVSLKTHDLGHKNLVLALFPFLWQLVQKTSFEGERRDQMTTTPLLWQKDIPWGIYCLLENEDVFRVQKNLEVVIDDYSQFLWVLLLLYLNYDINNNALLNQNGLNPIKINNWSRKIPAKRAVNKLVFEFYSC